MLTKHIVPKLRIGGALPPVYVFIACWIVKHGQFCLYVYASVRLAMFAFRM
jgi:hypothetical protein